MGVLDAMLNEAGSRLGIGNSSASSVLAGLLSFINQDDGGLSGFLNRFRRAGVGNLVTSWLGGDAKPVSADAVENAMGHDVVGQIASRAGITTSAAASAIALMLPRLVQRLAPGGAIPTRLPSDVASYMTGATAAMASGARQAVYAAETMAGPASAGVGRYLWPLLGLLLVAGFIVWLLTRGTPGGGVTFNMEEQIRLASQKAVAALTALKPGFSAQELVSAVNLEVINFATGSTAGSSRQLRLPEQGGGGAEGCSRRHADRDRRAHRQHGHARDEYAALARARGCRARLPRSAGCERRHADGDWLRGDEADCPERHRGRTVPQSSHRILREVTGRTPAAGRKRSATLELYHWWWSSE